MDKLDCWAEDDFEDTVASALIAVFESKVKKNKGAGPYKIKAKHLIDFRRQGAYVPGNSRLIFDTARKDGIGFFDTQNDPIPKTGCVGVKWTAHKDNPDEYHPFFAVVGYKRMSDLQVNFKPKIKGISYEVKIISCEVDGVIGDRRFVTLSPDGDIVAFDHSEKGLDRFGRIVTYRHSRQWEMETAAWCSMAMQFVADRRFCWSIEAAEDSAKVSIGCMKEEIKSLLYARNLPMTATGRKRPILHLVESHKRRMKSGTDIDIVPFLRGTQHVVIGGTKFKVVPPEHGKEALSDNSQRYFSQAALRATQ